MQVLTISRALPWLGPTGGPDAYSDLATAAYRGTGEGSFIAVSDKHGAGFNSTTGVKGGGVIILRATHRAPLPTDQPCWLARNDDTTGKACRGEPSSTSISLSAKSHSRAPRGQAGATPRPRCRPADTEVLHHPGTHTSFTLPLPPPHRPGRSLLSTLSI